jgi:ligand-binding sensor domain-containing protein
MEEFLKRITSSHRSMSRVRLPLLTLFVSLAIPSAHAAPHRYVLHPNPDIAILGITEGPDGFLWLAAQDGLYRFDGFHYQRVRDYPFDSARRIGATKDGSVWIVGQRGVVRFRNRFEIVTEQPTVEFSVLPDMIFAKGGRGNLGIGLDGVATPLHNPLNDYITIDGSGRMWVSSTTKRSAIQVQPGTSGTVQREVPLPDKFQQVMQDAQGRIWAGDASRVVEVGRQGQSVSELTRKQSSRAPRPYALFPGRNGQVWFLGETVHGLSPAIEFRGPLVHEQYQPTAGFEDSRGHVWVAKLGLGLEEWTPDPGWHRWSSEHFGGRPTAQAVRTKIGIVVATHNNIYRLEGEEWRPIAKEAREYSSVLPFDDGGFLATIRRLGLVRLRPSGEIAEVLPNPLRSNDEYRLLIADSKHRWVGNKTALLEIIGAPGSLQVREEHLPDIRQGHFAQAIDFEFDASGHLWAGYGEGIARRDDQGQWQHIPTDSPIYEVRSFTLADRKNGEDIWIAFRGGGHFARIQKQGEIWHVTDFAAKDGYGPEDSHFIKRDRRGWIWRGSPEGVHISDGVHLQPNDWLHLTLANGLATRSTDQFGFFEDTDGSVWITGEDGVTHIAPDPSWFQPGKNRRPPSLSRIEIDGSEIPVEQAKALSPVKQSLRIDLGTLDASHLRDFPIRYRFRPRFEDWRFSRDGTIELEGVDDGSYTLEAGLADGIAVALPLRIGNANHLSWLWWVPLPVGGGMLALFGPWFPWAERVRYRFRKILFLLHRRFARKDSSSGGSRGEVRDYAGQTVGGRYRLGRLVSRGGFSVVYEAHDLEKQHGRVAVKILTAAPTNESWVRDRFAHEVAALRSVDHRAIVPIIDSWISPDGEPCLVMPYLEGPTLRQALKDGPLTPTRAALTIREMGVALSAVHARGVVHRDLKPENVILTGPGGIQPVMIDFGTATLRGRQDELAATTMLSGSFHYMAPERLSGHYSPESDVYSFGVIALELATAKRLADLHVLFSDDKFRPTLLSVVKAVLPLEIAESFVDLVAKAYDPRPQLRPSDVKAWSEAIAELLERA